MSTREKLQSTMWNSILYLTFLSKMIIISKLQMAQVIFINTTPSRRNIKGYFTNIMWTTIYQGYNDNSTQDEMKKIKLQNFSVVQIVVTCSIVGSL